MRMGRGLGRGNPAIGFPLPKLLMRSRGVLATTTLCRSPFPPPVFLGGNGRSPLGDGPCAADPAFAVTGGKPEGPNEVSRPARQMSGAVDGWSFTKQRCSDSPEARRATAWERPAASACLCRRHALHFSDECVRLRLTIAGGSGSQARIPVAAAIVPELVNDLGIVSVRVTAADVAVTTSPAMVPGRSPAGRRAVQLGQADQLGVACGPGRRRRWHAATVAVAGGRQDAGPPTGPGRRAAPSSCTGPARRRSGRATTARPPGPARCRHSGVGGKPGHGRAGGGRQ